MQNWPLLSLLIWLPILGGALVLALGDKRPQAARWVSLAIALAVFALSIPLFTGFDYAATGLQFLERRAWIPAYDIQYHLGADGISVALIILTTLTTALVLVGAWTAIDKRVNQYYAAMLVLEGLMIGVFSAVDALLFYVFFEGMLIPMFIIIGVWGGPRRVYASIKFFLYTFLGSVFMLVGLVYLYLKAGSWQLPDLYALPLSSKEQMWLFFAFLAAFAVKVPMFPVHTWLPDAHVEAPTGGSVILAAIMLKIGGYGFLRFSLPITPDAGHEWAWLVIALSLIAVVYVGLVALVQEDMKKLIAYSSVSHMGFVTLGIFIAFALIRDANSVDAARLGLQGAMVQMISHGFISGAMFSCVGVLYDRMHTRMIKDYGGVANVMPWFTFFMVLFAMANSGLPGTSGFVGEFMVILASFQQHPLIAFAAALTLIIGAGYTLWLVKRVMFGEVANAHVAELEDINYREWIVLGTFAAGTLLIGVWPKPLTDLMEPAIAQLASQLAMSKL
ncbi:NADH-quinone oxidoreductase subunit M [Luteimonas marina]|uniref:NADH-quinone oxidoreductase subunit M n=1 Tax=Luteimonas marina TaxID=488485 RepID=A0A5C5UCA2_9GAMM|nr:NADH-quinone oxidoreductase subunit M [Luteimonas marina]TWT23262.1 NADH-quinone oxidoreductase subunit M [Luteimonas marina]